MAVDLNYTLADAMLNTYDTHFPAGSLLQFRSGPPPGAENAASGTLLAEITTPVSPWGAAGNGTKPKANIWSVTAVAGGTIGHYRFKNAADTKREEGTVTATGGGGDITVDNLVITVTQVITVNTFTKIL